MGNQGRGQPGVRVERREVTVAIAQCADCEHPTSALTRSRLLEAQRDHDRRSHPDVRERDGFTLRAHVRQKTVLIDVKTRAS